MAQKVEVHLEDDLDGGPADHTLTFALDGRDYEIDLSEANAEKLREALRPFVAAGRKTTHTGTRSTLSRSTGARSSSIDPDTAKIRAWAKENSHPISDRGRIHQSVKDAYYAAH
ncbi:histone-like nucleoid-structuring protein Lsr2 [Kocuria rosea]|uniref:histone-like nucleoid-structuring protein Lsr2 n=1 Tax=Kocuria rosea TaxID=1275 RepID=UPI00203F7AA7|nr:Lsr2 family protein [Kocuria rosea]MCM3687092.1 Lsr2 family protein [Kocuria rosea]